MMWSKAELENLALGGAEVAAERVMKHLSRPENADIFAAENFSYLWGALGVAGLRGTDAAARRKIWQVLKENGVPDAFEKEYSEILRGNWRRGIKTTGCGHGTGLIIFRPELSFRKRYWKNWQNMIKNLKKMFYHIVLIIKN